MMSPIVSNNTKQQKVKDKNNCVNASYAERELKQRSFYDEIKATRIRYQKKKMQSLSMQHFSSLARPFCRKVEPQRARRPSNGLGGTPPVFPSPFLLPLSLFLSFLPLAQFEPVFRIECPNYTDRQLVWFGTLQTTQFEGNSVFHVGVILTLRHEITKLQAITISTKKCS